MIILMSQVSRSLPRIISGHLALPWTVPSANRIFDGVWPHPSYHRTDCQRIPRPCSGDGGCTLPPRIPCKRLMRVRSARWLPSVMSGSRRTARWTCAITWPPHPYPLSLNSRPTPLSSGSFRGRVAGNGFQGHQTQTCPQRGPRQS